MMQVLPWPLGSFIWRREEGESFCSFSGVPSEQGNPLDPHFTKVGEDARSKLIDVTFEE